MVLMKRSKKGGQGTEKGIICQNSSVKCNKRMLVFDMNTRGRLIQKLLLAPSFSRQQIFELHHRTVL